MVHCHHSTHDPLATIQAEWAALRNTVDEMNRHHSRDRSYYEASKASVRHGTSTLDAGETTSGWVLY